MCELLEDQRRERYGIVFTEEQFRILKELYDLFDEDPSSDPNVMDTGNRSVRIKKLFQFVILLLCHRNADDQLRSPLCYFTSVLGIDRKTKEFRTPYNYTSYIAGLMWVARLLLLEYILPKHGYAHLDWPDRSNHPDWGQRMEDIRKPYMIHGSYSLFSFMANLLAYGKSIAVAEGTVYVE